LFQVFLLTTLIGQQYKHAPSSVCLSTFYDSFTLAKFISKNVSNASLLALAEATQLEMILIAEVSRAGGCFCGAKPYVFLPIEILLIRYLGLVITMGAIVAFCGSRDPDLKKNCTIIVCEYRLRK
jgi:hypothetical protein